MQIVHLFWVFLIWDLLIQKFKFTKILENTYGQNQILTFLKDQKEKELEDLIKVKIIYGQCL